MKGEMRRMGKGEHGDGMRVADMMMRGMPKMAECMLGRPVERHSPARLGPKSRQKVEAAMREVHEDMPSTVERAHVSGARKERMLRAVAYSKARKRGANV